MSHTIHTLGGSDALAMVQEQQALTKAPPSAPSSPAPEPAPVVEMEKPKDFAVVVSFGAATTITENPTEIPKLETATLANVSTFLASHGDKQPVAITRTGDTYIINMGNNQMIKARTGNIEEAVHKGVIKEGSPLLASLKMTELTTSADLPAKAQRKIQGLATSTPTAKVPDPFKKAQDSAIFAAYVEKFAKIMPSVDARVKAVYAGNDAVTSQWADFKAAYAQAGEDGDYEAAFNTLNTFTATIETIEKGSDSPWLKPQLPEKDALPPSNIITMANLASIKLRTAVVNSGQDVADPKAIGKTIKAPTLTVDDKAAIANPRQFLADHGNDWNAARKMYREGKLTHPGAGMQALLDFRKTVVDDILRQVKVETKAHVLARKEKLNETLPEGEKLPLTCKDLSWSAAGSTDATSDVDTSLSGEGTEFAAQRFNELFSAAWERDSGIVFDVNVYARDFVPQLDKMAFHKTSKAELSDDVQTKAENTITWDTDIRGTKYEPKFQAFQEKQAFYSTRSHMSKAEWGTFRKAQLDACEALSPSDRLKEKTRLTTVFNEVETKFRDHNKAVAAEAGRILGRPVVIDPEMPHATLHALEHEFHGEGPSGKLKAETLALKAENRIYHTCLKTNEGLREKRQIAEVKLGVTTAKLKGKEADLVAARKIGNPMHVQRLLAEVGKLKQEVASQTDGLQKLTFDLKVAISESLNYANETYATEAALLHTVGNKQMLSKGPYADIGSKPRMGKIKLTEQQWTQAFHEQVGMSFKELTRRDNMGDSLIQGGKYIHRALNAAKHIQKMTGQPVPGPPSLDFLRFLAKETVGTKKDGKVIDTDKGARAIANLEDWILANPKQKVPLAAASNQEEMRKVLMAFTTNVAKSYQGWVAKGRPEPDKDHVSVVKGPKIHIPDSSYRATKQRASADDLVRMVDTVHGRVAVPVGLIPAKKVVVSMPQPEVAVVVSVTPSPSQPVQVAIVVPKDV
jgi:hypothetical protein